MRRGEGIRHRRPHRRRLARPGGRRRKTARTNALWPGGEPDPPSFRRSEAQTPIPGEDGPTVSVTLHPHRTKIESVHIRGFRSLADVELDGLGRTVVLIGANGSGKSNLIRFFEMLSWMLRARRLAEFIERQGGGGRSALRWPQGDASHPGGASTVDRPGPKRLSFHARSRAPRPFLLYYRRGLAIQSGGIPGDRIVAASG